MMQKLNIFEDLIEQGYRILDVSWNWNKNSGASIHMVLISDRGVYEAINARDDESNKIMTRVREILHNSARVK